MFVSLQLSSVTFFCFTPRYKNFRRQFLNRPTWLCDKSFEIRTPLSCSSEHWCCVSVLVFKYLTAKMSRGEGKGRNVKHTEKRGGNYEGLETAGMQEKKNRKFCKKKKKSVSLKVTMVIWYAIYDKALRRYFSWQNEVMNKEGRESRVWRKKRPKWDECETTNKPKHTDKTMEQPLMREWWQIRQPECGVTETGW